MQLSGVGVKTADNCKYSLEGEDGDKEVEAVV